MRNSLLALPLLESNWLINSKSPDWKYLKKRFSGQLFYRNSYFNLLNGDLSVLSNKNNGWLLENILNHSASNQDKNLIPVLQKIAAGSTFDDSIRDRASEIIKTEWAVNNLSAGIRSPQTSEILRLLRGQSTGSKRLAICMIGKYKLSDMLQEVGLCLGIRGLEIDSAAVLQSFGTKAGNELRHIYFKSSGNNNTCRAILRILSHTGSKEDQTFLFERLWSNSIEIKEAALRGLIVCKFKVPEEATVRFDQLIYEVTGTIVWILSALVCLKKSKDEFLYNTLNKEIIFWKRILYSLFYISDDSAHPGNSAKNKNSDATGISKFFPELIDIIYNESNKPSLEFFSGIMPEEKKLKRLHKIIPGGIPDYKNLIEDLLNRDYNHLSIWTKACTLRNIKVIEDADQGDSVAALMFSPEELLQEEAARLLARSNMELYRSVSDRIPDGARNRLDRIISGQSDEKELLFGKVSFLSTLFPGISEDKLLFLARSIKFVRKFAEASLLSTESFILWFFQSDSIVPAFVKIHFADGIKFKGTDDETEDSYCYILDLSNVEDYYHLYPEDSVELLEYIDKNELQES